MKGSVIAAVAALTGAATAKLHNRHAHPKALDRRGDDTCECTTYTETIYGKPTLLGVHPVKPTPSSSAPAETTTIEVEAVVVPTPAVEVCPTPGTYTFPATTLTLTETTTVCGASSTQVPAGHHTLGGVTTVVDYETTVVCPYATVHTDDGVVTSVIETTTYVCPSAGTYTIAPMVTDVVEETIIVIPVVETYCPGTYTRDEVVTTITETSVVVVCPYTDAAATPVATTPTYDVEGSEATEEVEVEEVEEEEEEEEEEETTTSVGSSGDHYAMTYTPYNDNHLCKSQSDVEADISAIAAAGFSAVRVYSTDCSTLEYVGGACATYGIKMIVGIFMDSAGCSNSGVSVEEQISAIASWGKWELVELVVVGNEGILGGKCTASEIAGYISSCKSAFSGYSGPYTTAETLNVWQQTDVSSVLCSAVDIVGANIHPYFNAEVSPETAGDFVAGQLDLIDGICSGKTGVNLECGWPSAGVTNGAAVPGTSEQATAISSIRAAAGTRTTFFSYHNDGWKEAGSCGCEQSWGCGDLF